MKLVCECGGDFLDADETVICVDCERERPVDIGGVVYLTERDLSWPDVPENVLDQVRDATTAEEIIDAMLDPRDPWSQSLQARLLHPAGAAAVTLDMPAPGMDVLDLGTGWPALASALQSFGARTTSADPVPLRLRFEQLMHDQPAVEAVHLSLSSRLPWEPSSFDRVFVDAHEVRRSGADLATILAEVRRVLKDNGSLIMGLDHRAAVSRRKLRRMLAKHGLTLARVAAPVPHGGDWSWLVPEHRLRVQLLDEIKRRRRARVLSKQTAKRVLVALGGARWIAQGRYVVACAGQSPPPTSPLAAVLGEHSSRSPSIMRLSDARVAIFGSESFVKLPLSEQQQRALLQEAQNTRLARETAFAPFVIGSEHVGDWNGLPYVRYPLLRERIAQSDEAAKAVEAVLHAVAPGQDAPLRDTVLWERLSSARAERDAAEAGGSHLRQWALKELGDVAVPVGPTHGDLHQGNVLLTHDRPPILVDWNRFELRNPLLLDAGYAAIEHHRRTTGANLAEALASFRDRRLDGPLAVHAASVRGGLSDDAAAVVILLDRLVSYSLPRRRYKPWTMGPMLKAVQALGRPS